MSDDFMDSLNRLKEDWNKPFVPKVSKPPARPKVELTQQQKRVIVGYMLGGISKGVFEDCPDFWRHSDGKEMTEEEIDRLYGAYYDAAERFLDQIKQHLLDTL